MEQAEKLADLLRKLKANEEKVPLEVLKTTYKAAYDKLCQEIKETAQTHLKETTLKTPYFLDGRKVTKEHGEALAGIYNQIYEAGEYAKKIGRALFKNYSIAEAEALAAEINKTFQEESLKYFHSRTCLYATAECFNTEDTKTPKIYNDLVDMFWDEEAGGWREPKEGERENAILIFVKGKEDKDNEQNRADHGKS